MKLNRSHFSSILLAGPLLFSACLPKEELQQNLTDPLWTQTLPLDEWQQVETAKEFSQLLGEVMQSKEARVTLSAHIQQYDDFGDAISLSTLLGDKQNMPPSELASLNRLGNTFSLRTASNPFREALLQHSLERFEAYPFLERAFETFRARPERAQQRVSLQEELIAFFASQGLVIHFPYEERFDWDNYTGSITTTYDPLIREDWNEGFLFSLRGGGSQGSLVPFVDDTYSLDHATLVVTYLDEDFYEMNNTPPVPVLPTPAPNAVILDYNVNHTSISQADILFSTIPEVKLTNKEYKVLFSRFVKVRLFRGSSKVKISFNGTISATAEGETFRYDMIRFSKDDIESMRWKTVNLQFDPDWDMSENSQQLLLFTELRRNGKGKGTASAKVGYDFVNQKPTAEFTSSVTVETELDNSVFRTNSELSRPSILAHIIGPGNFGVRTRNGIDYNVKSVGPLHFYFEHRFTDIQD
ncbi:MAG: hypothetical protein RLZZ358_1085 [Bacteroidota bacterium]|jgi:hypothetical protein